MFPFPTKTINHLSYSQINLFSTCPLSWWLEYILEVPSTKSVYMAIGSAIHTALHSYFTDRLLGITPMCTDDLVTHADECIKSTLEESEYTMPKTGQSLENVIDSRLLGLQQYMESVGRNLTVRFTEKRITRKIPGSNLDFVGVIDLITSDRRVIDFKVVSAPWSQNKANESLQSHAYGFLVDSQISFEFHCISPKSPRVLPVSVSQNAVDSYAGMASALSWAMTEVAAGRQAPECSRDSSSCFMCNQKAACELYRYQLFDDLMELAKVPVMEVSR